MAETLVPTIKITVSQPHLHIDGTVDGYPTQTAIITFGHWFKGDKGDDGKSAYEIWLEEGHTGTEEDFLEWLKEDGAYIVNFKNQNNEIICENDISEISEAIIERRHIVGMYGRYVSGQGGNLRITDNIYVSYNVNGGFNDMLFDFFTMRGRNYGRLIILMSSDGTCTSDSFNYFTSWEREKLDGIESGAQRNVQSDWGEDDPESDAYILHKPNIPSVNDGTLTIQKNGSQIGYFSANTDKDEIINIRVPTSAADVNALPASTAYGASLSLTMNSSTYVLTARLKDQNGNNLGTAQTVDLPLESVVVNGTYDSKFKRIVLTLQNGNTIYIPVGDLINGLQNEITTQNPLSADLVTDGNTNKVFTATEQTKLANIEAGAEVNVQSDWNESESENDAFIKNKPTVDALYVEKTYAQLKAMVDGGTLVKGQKYRITDYVTTTTQTNTSSANHAFDLVVTATDTNKLDCMAQALPHFGDTYFSTAGADLTKWQVWYDINNDTTKYDWADTTNGKGVIYRLIDEWYNDCPYDFKNILFTISGKQANAYTFNVYTNSACSDHSLNGAYCYGNVMKSRYNSGIQNLNFNVFYNTSITDYCYSNTLGNNCSNNIFGNNCYSNTLWNYCYSNTFGNSCYYNKCGNIFANNTLGNSSIFNTFGNECSNNNILNSSNNTFGNGCGSNTFVNNCRYNTFMNNCSYNKLGDSCSYNTLGDKCSNIIFGNSSNPSVGGTYCRYNVIENGNQNIRLYQTTGTAGNNNQLQNVYIAQGVNNTTTWLDISTISRNLSYRTTVAKLSNGTIRIYKEDEDDINVQSNWNESDNTDPAYIANKPTLGTAAALDVAASGNASSAQVVKGDDTRLTDSRPASDVYQWAKEASKPTYTASEVGAIPSTEKGANGGVAELDANGKVPSAQLPSYVDDVLEYASLSAFPATGESGKIYIALDTNKTYRWSGSAYTEISASLALGETSSTAYRGDRGKTAYDHSQVTDGSNPHNTTFANIADKPTTIAGYGITDAFSGSYNDLTDKPTIPAAQVNSDWNASSGVAQILNKPTIPSITLITWTNS